MSRQRRRDPVTGNPPVSASPEVKRRIKRLTYFALPFSLASLALSLVPIESEPWLWFKSAILVIGTVVFVIWITRFSLWQRDEYWRERGRNPKHPERFPEPPSE